jgi:hypothetical protein
MSPRTGSEVTKPRIDTPPIIVSPVKPSGPEDTSTRQEDQEKLESKPDDKSLDTTSSKDPDKPSEASKKKFPFEES